MAWRYKSDDNRIEVIVATDFRGDLVALALHRPVWIVDAPLNRPRIDAVWAVGADLNLCEVTRYTYHARVADSRVENLLEIIACLDDHHPNHDLAVHGIAPAELGAALLEEGFLVEETTPDGFVAVQVPGVRDPSSGEREGRGVWARRRAASPTPSPR
jgi:hypothetical protein